MSIRLDTTYLGLHLKNPIVASASPITGRLDALKRLEDHGIAAVTLPSLFEEQIEHDAMEINHLQESGAEAFAEAAEGYFPDLVDYNTGPDAYLELIGHAKAALEVPVIASLNGISPGGWLRYAKSIQDAGADALELNVYFVPADPRESSAEVEARYVDLVEQVRSKLTIPLALKMSPFFSAPANMALRLVDAGADGLVLFNRFMQPDIDLETLDVEPSIQLSTSTEVRLPLRWIAILRDHVEASLAATSGAHAYHDVLKLLLAGADAVCIASAFLRNGPAHVEHLLAGVTSWMVEREYESVEQMKGSVSKNNSADPIAFERSNYMQALASYTSSW